MGGGELIPAILPEIFYGLHKSYLRTTVAFLKDMLDRIQLDAFMSNHDLLRTHSSIMGCLPSLPTPGQLPPHLLHGSFNSVVLSCQGFFFKALGFSGCF